MKPSVVFRNPGIMDMRAVKVMGLHAKVEENPIGYFGTGLKFAIATLLRHEHAVTIISGGKHYTFHTKTDNFRDTAVQFVYMNEEELPFTLQLGKNWEVWMAFRELYSNMLDEKGECSVHYKSEPIPFHKDETVIIVSGKEIAVAHSKLHEIFLPPMPPLVEHPNLQIFPGETRYMYYRGVRAGEWHKPCAVTINFISPNIVLTEDRTIKNPGSELTHITEAIVQLQDRATLTKFIVPDDRNFEYEWSYYGLIDNDRCSSLFIELVPELRGRHAFDVSQGLYDFWKRKTKYKDSNDLIPYSPTEIELGSLAKAKDFLAQMRLFEDKYPIRFVKHLGTDVLASADQSECIIYIAEECFRLGTKKLAHALFEEYVHIEYGMLDHSRQLQTFLFEKIIHLGEELVWRQPL